MLHNPPDLYAARFAATEQGELGEMLGEAHRTAEACAALAAARADYADLAARHLLLPRDSYNENEIQGLTKQYCEADDKAKRR
jgi:hypothetical protein